MYFLQYYHYVCHLVSKPDRSLPFLYFHLVENSTLDENLQVDEVKPETKQIIMANNKKSVSKNKIYLDPHYKFFKKSYQI